MASLATETTRSYRGEQTLHSIARFFLLLLPLAIILDRAYPDVIISTIAIFYVIHCTFARDTRCLRAGWLQMALLFWAYCCLRNLFVDDWQKYYGLVATWLRFPAFAAALAYWLLPNASTQRWMMRGLIAMLIFILGDTLFQYFHGTDIFGHVPFRAEALLRLTGPFVKNRVGITLAWFSLPLLLTVVQPQEKNCRTQLLAIGLLIFTLIDIYLSGERMALIAFVVGLGLSALLYRPLRRAMAAALTASLLFCAIFSYFNSDLATRQFGSTKTVLSHFGDSAYGLPWISALQVGADNPLFGVGYKHFTPTCLADPPAPDRLEVRCPMHPHSIYLEIWAESGAFGLVMFLAMAAFILRDMWQNQRIFTLNPLLVGLAITLLLRLWPISPSASVYAAWALIPFWWYLGWFYALLTAKRSALDEPNRFV